jgi:hypothetical protein
MQPDEKHLAAATAIDKAFRAGEYVAQVQTDRETYKRWYARLLTAIVVTAGGEEIIWSQMQLRAEDNEAFFTVLTGQVVILGHAKAIHVDEPLVEVRAIGRSSLAELDVIPAIEIDREGASSLAWPGDVQIAANYYAPDKQTVVFVAYGKESNQTTEAPVLRLLAELQKDLNA